jgi:hypothetical protein
MVGKTSKHCYPHVCTRFFCYYIFPFQTAIVDYNDDDKVGIQMNAYILLKVLFTIYFLFVVVVCCVLTCPRWFKVLFNLLWHMKFFQCILNIVGYALTSCSFFLIISTITCILGLYFDICFW